MAVASLSAINTNNGECRKPNNKVEAKVKSINVMNKVHLLIPLWKAIVQITHLMYNILGGRTHNILGEFAEHIVADALKGKLQPPSNKAFDILLSDGKTVQVKARKLSGKYRYSETLSDFHSWNFDILIVVLFNDDGTLKQVLQMDSKLARTFIHPRKKSGQADIITLSKKFVSAANDITSCFSTYKI